MRYTRSLSRRRVLLIAIICPALLGSKFKCVAVSNPSPATARIEQLDPAAPRVGDVVQATASGSGSPPLQFAWDFGDGGALAPGKQASHVYTVPGSYLISLTVQDAMGHTARDSAKITVSPRVPPLMPTVMLISDAIANQPVEFLALAFDAEVGAFSSALPSRENGALSYAWTFSDGQSAIGSHAAAIFTTAGVYRASVMATDDAGAIAVAEIVFEVADATAR